MYELITSFSAQLEHAQVGLPHALEPIPPCLVKMCEYFETNVNAEFSVFSFIPNSVSVHILLFT